MQIYKHLPDCINEAITRDLVEVNYGLTRKATDSLTAKEVNTLFQNLSVMPKLKDSAKTRLLKRISASTNAECIGLERTLNKYGHT